MKVGYKKDLNHNYMVITELENIESQPYSTRILERQRMKGIIPLDQRKLDNECLLYYDITGRQSMAAIYDKALFTKEKIKQLCIGVINIIEYAYEYLLPEDDFILEPEYIYMDIATDEPSLCFIPGYEKNIKTQMTSLMEYLMNKVDYNDKEAVLLVYQLYALSREEGYTFNHLREELLASNQPVSDKQRIRPGESINNMDKINHQQNIKMRSASNTKLESTLENDPPQVLEGNIQSENISTNDFSKRKNSINLKDNLKSKEALNPNVNIRTKENLRQKETLNALSRMTVMKEKIEREEEVSCYPVTTYLYTAGCIIGGFLILLASLTTKIIYNSYGDQIDYTKLAALLLIVFSVEGYCLKIIWGKKNMITKIITKNEYVDPRQLLKPFDKRKLFGVRTEDTNHYGLSKKESLIKENQEEEQNASTDHNSNTNFKANSQDSSPLRIEKAKNKNNASLEISNIEYTDISNHYTKTNNTYCSMNETSLPKHNSNKLEEQNYNDADNPTCLLNAPIQQNVNSVAEGQTYACILKPLDEISYQPIGIKDSPFFIGKLKKNVDYCLEKDVVSRYHAKITKEEENYFITDLNSTNGTFVNGISMQTYEKKMIVSGDEIAFANIKYQFEIVI